jgi:hypothetical protein
VHATDELHARIMRKRTEDVPRPEDEIEALRLKLADLAHVHVEEARLPIAGTRQSQHRRDRSMPR